jgi:hypothetical protein
VAKSEFAVVVDTRDHELLQLIEERRQAALLEIAKMREQPRGDDGEAAIARPNGRNGEHD